MDRLLQTIFGHIVRTGNLTIISASGKAMTFGDGTGESVVARFTSRSWQLRTLLDPELRLGEAYMDGGFVVERGSIADFLDLVIFNMSKQKPNAFIKALRNVRRWWRNTFVSNTLFRASRNARHHYNIDHRLYRLFLDKDMQYSCAYFARPDMTIEEAQLAKKRHIAGKLLINRHGLRILDIGSGWGGLGLHLARQEHKPSVVGINLSDEQVKIARQRAADEKANVEFRIQDYRKVDEKFDRIVSVGMFEHVGKPHYAEYFKKCFEILDDNGLMLLHSIGRWDAPAATNAWVWKYIFPGGYTPTLSEITPIIEKAGFIIADIEVLRIHYAETLKRWRERFLAHRNEVLKLFDERFIRMWEFYLAGFEPSFRYDGLNVFQIQLIKRNSIDTPPITRNYMYPGSEESVRARMMTAAE
ncbi:MAG: Cyclopropane-fatty-acyl-phospholipid synthase [Pseudolabrys sp.]|jgi:cyclopropane-fatty-acyl-phospholipid synthase|nr:Cyclopropane-fatty-acyl-phospholipid synthase [Pseudolabrys sp.]